VGAVVVYDHKIIGKGHNLTEQLHDVTAHAEMQAITAAANHIGAKYLTECTLYVTLEPCVMCAGAIYWSQLGKLVYGASDPKRGFMKEGQHLLHPKTELESGILGEDAASLIKAFFQKLR
jgi:tRNA(adenine34) deaminase